MFLCLGGTYCPLYGAEEWYRPTLMLQVPLECQFEIKWQHTFKLASFSYSNKYTGHAHSYVHYTLPCTPHTALMVLLHGHHRLKDNITMVLSDTGREGIDWIDLAQDTNKWCTVSNNVLSLWVPCNMGNFLTHQRSTGFSGQPLLYATG